MNFIKKYKKYILVIIIIILIIAIFEIFAIRGKESDSGSALVKVDCTSTAETLPQKYSGWSTSLYAAPLSNESSNSNVTDNGVRTFSMSELQDKTSANSLYFRVEKADGGTVGGVKAIVEFCNTDNQTKKYETTSTTTTSAAGADSIAIITYLHGGIYYLQEPGNYRADAYIYTDGSWHFTDRINSIELTE